MSINGKGGAAKSRKSAAKVCGEFGAVGGIVLVGGVLAVGIAAGAIACLRRRPRKMLDKPGEKHGENSSLEGKVGVPMSENVEEVEPIMEIANMEKLSVENFRPMDLELSANEKSINRSKGVDSPRSHFSLSTSFETSASVSSDSEDLVEINQMSFTENGFVTIEETSGKTSFDFRVVTESGCISGKELVEQNVECEESVDSFNGLEENENVGGQKANDCKESGQFSLVCKERIEAEDCVEFVGGDREDDNVRIKESECISGKELVEQNVEYEESVDSFDGLEESEKLGGQKANDCKESGRSSLICKERFDAEECVEFMGEDREDDNVSIKESECISGKELVEQNVEYEESVDLFDGLEESEKVGGQKVNDCKESGQPSLVCKERFDADECVEFVSEDREDDNISIKDDGSMHDEKFHLPIDGIDATDVSCEGRIVEIDVLKVSEFVKGDLCQDRQEKDQMGADAKEETILSNNEDLQEKVDGSEGLNCDKEECWQAVIGRGEGLTSVKEDCSEDFPRREGDSNVDFGHCDGRGEHGEVDISEEQQSRQEIVGTNQEVIFCKEGCLQEKIECNEGRCGEENTDSEESDNRMVNVGCKEEQCSTVVSSFGTLDYSTGVGHCEEKFQHGELEFSKETSCYTEEQIWQESVKPKEFESTEADDYSHQDTTPHELSNAKEEVYFCKEKDPEQKTFESSIEQYLLERVNSEEKPEERKVKLAHEGEQGQQGIVDSRGFEVLDYEGAFSRSDKSDQQKEKFLEQNCSPINETAQNKELERGEAEVHDRQHGHGQVSVDMNGCVILCKEQSIQEENLELNVKQCHQEKTDTVDDLKGCHVDIAHKGEQCQHGTVDFWGLEGLDYKGSSNNGDEVGQHGELEDSEENLVPINEQSLQETLEHKELDCKEVEVPGHQDGHKSEPDGANKEKKSALNVEQCSQDKSDCIAAVANKGDQCQIGKVNSRNFGGLDEDASHENGSCQYGPVGTRELDNLNRDSHSEKEQFENEWLNSKEDIQNEKFENGSLKSMEDIENEQFENGRLNSKEFVEMDIGLEEKLSPQEENIKEPQEALEVSVMEMECEENAVHSKETGIDGDAHIFKERPQQEALDSNESQNFVEDIFVYHEPCKGTTCESVESILVEEEMAIVQEEYKQEIVNTVDIQDSVEYIPVMTLQCHREINESDELGGVSINEPQGALEVSVMVMECEENAIHPKETGVDRDAHIIKEKPQEETVDSNESQNFVEDIFVNDELCKGATCESESEFIGENMPIAQEEYKLEIVNSVDIQNSIECIPVTTLQCHIEINESDELGGVTLAMNEPQEALEVSVMEMECEENAVHSNETGIYEDAQIFRENPQQEAMDSNKSQNFVEDTIVYHELCKGTTCESEKSEFVEESMPISQEEYKEEIVNSVDLQDSVECIPVTTLQCHREINESDEVGVAIRDPQEALEVSAMEMECEENAVHPKETGVDGDAHIFKEKPEEETMDSNESLNFVEDIFVDHELCKGTTCESKESKFVEDNMPISQEEYKQEIVDSVDIHDSVECKPVMTLQCHREINESDELEGAVIPREKYEGDAVCLEQLELSDNLHSHNEPCEQEERLGEQSPPSLKEIAGFEQTNDLEYQNQCKKSQDKEIDTNDLGYSSSIVLELSPNDPDCTEAYECSQEDQQTYSRPEVIGTQESEYSYGDTIEKEKFQLETVDQLANDHYREEQEICPEQEEVDDENLSTHAHHLNDQYEANQDTCATTMSESCKLLGVSEEFKLDDESTDSKSVAPLASEPREASNTSPITEREKKARAPLHSSQLVSNSEEGKSLWMKQRRPLYMRTRTLVSLFAALLAFLFAYKFANMPETVFAS